MLTLMAAAMMFAAQPLPPLDDFLKEFSKRRAGITALQASFVQENKSEGDTESVTGTIFYANPRRIIFRYPESDLTYLFDDLRVYEYDAGTAEVKMHELEDNPQTEALFLGFGEDVGRLQQAYDLELFQPEEGTCGTVGVTLRPKNRKDDEGIFEAVKLYLQGDNYLPCRVVIVNDKDSTVTINVFNYKVNMPFTAQDTQIKVAEGTRMFREDQPFGDPVGPEGMWLPETPIISQTDLPAPPKAPAP